MTTPSVPSPLISAEALAALVGQASTRPTVLDIRWDLATGPDREAYVQGHLPGARFVDLDADLAGPAGAGGRHPLPDADAFAGAMRAAGVRHDRAVVVYDARTSTAAARAWWLLRYFGHGQVAVLDGGLAAWAEAGYPLEHGLPRHDPGDFVARPGAMPLLDASGAARISDRGVLLDARAPERFSGEREPIDPVAGHIPGAVNRPTSENLGADGRFRSPQTLHDEFAQLGIGQDTALGVYCGSGVTATHELLALELAGYGAALYAGSWSEWIRDPARPVQTGPGQASENP